MAKRNPYLELLNLARRSTEPNTIQEIETLAVQVGLLHNALGEGLKDLISIAVKQKRETSCHVIEEDKENDFSFG